MSAERAKATGEETVIQPLILEGGRVDWLGSGEQWISFDRKGDDGFTTSGRLPRTAAARSA